MPARRPPEAPPPPDDPDRPTWRGRDAARYFAAISEFTGAATGGVLAGFFVDTRFHTDPWGLLVGGMLGLVAGFYGLYVVLSRFDRR